MSKDLEIIVWISMYEIKLVYFYGMKVNELRDGSCIFSLYFHVYQ